jgi:predicted CoA-substrate-specific enzyme activase
MNTVIGIDLGSRTTKILTLAEGEIRHSEIFDTGHDPLARIRQSLDRLEPAPVMATGYGRHLLREEIGARVLTEIRACGKGVRSFFPTARLVLDVGGQDCKVIALEKSGKVSDFEMNDRCAAGTGKFLEVMAQTFETDLEGFVRLARSAERHVAINSMCTVFAESEVVSLITTGRPRNQIARGLHVAIADRLSAMVKKFPAEGDIVFVGGGARNGCLHALLEKRLRSELLRPENPQLITAYGAALLA